jgi:hypothetical protein
MGQNFAFLGAESRRNLRGRVGAVAPAIPWNGTARGGGVQNVLIAARAWIATWNCRALPPPGLLGPWVSAFWFYGVGTGNFWLRSGHLAIFAQATSHFFSRPPAIFARPALQFWPGPPCSFGPARLALLAQPTLQFWLGHLALLAPATLQL